MDAVIALRNIVDAYSEDHLDAMKPHLPSLLDSLFRLMAEVLCFSTLGLKTICFAGHQLSQQEAFCSTML